MQIIEWVRTRNEGFSEILGTVLLLSIAVIIFSSLLVHVMSGTCSTPVMPRSDLVGCVADDGASIIIEHCGGDIIRWEDTQVILNVEGIKTETIVFDAQGNAYNDRGDSLGDVAQGDGNGDEDGLWELGESFCYAGISEYFDSGRLRTIVIDTVSNVVLMSGTIHDGRFIDCISTDDTIMEDGGRWL